ncbi:MAG: PTS sugar transporter subunit IIB [Traorella sp.]
MILKLRIDDRLLHGQVAYSWKAKLNYNAIVIVSDSAAKDELRRATIRMCCPDGVKLATRSVEDAIKLLKNDKLKSMKVFVVCPDPKTAYEVITQINEKPVINLGGMQKKEGTQLFSKAVYMSDEDKEYCDKLIEKGFNIEVQEVPETSMSYYKNLRK